MNVVVQHLFSGHVRGKKKKAGGATRNKAGSPAGLKYGLKVYDGQRIPAGSTLYKQPNLSVMPGWNVRNLSSCAPEIIRCT